MKGKNPTRKQKILMKENNLNPNNWLVLKILKDKLWIQHKISQKTRDLKFQ